MYKVLLADDVKVTLAAEKAQLEQRNLKVIATTSGTEAVKLAADIQPDLVILDFEMPEMTGVEVCKRLKKDPQTRHIPVLILSIHDDEKIMKQCEEAGAQAYVRKGDGREALLESVAKALGVPRRRHVRVPCLFTVGIVEEGRLFSGVVENISASGMFLTVNRQFAAGMALRLRFELPAVDQEIRVLGEVVRVVEFGENSHGCGIQFLNTDPQSRKRLDQFIETSI